MDKLSLIKLRMEENLKELKRYQEEQIKKYEYLMGLNDIDEIDAQMQDIEEDFRLTTIFKDIEVYEKRNLEELMDLVWKSKEVKQYV
jgi:hypothetical protein